MPHPQPKTNNNYIDDDLNTADLGSPPINFIPYNSPSGSPIVNGMYSINATCVPGSDGKLEAILDIPYNSGLGCQGVNGIIVEYNLLDISGATTGVANSYVTQNYTCVANYPSAASITGSPALYTFIIPNGATAGAIRFPYCNLAVGSYIITVVSTTCLGSSGSNTPLVWNVPITTHAPCPEYYCQDFNCLDLTPSNSAWVASALGTSVMFSNVDDCIACCGGVNQPTYVNGSPNPHYHVTYPGTTANASYMAFALLNGLPTTGLGSSGTFSAYMLSLGIDSCGQI